MNRIQAIHHVLSLSDSVSGEHACSTAERVRYWAKIVDALHVLGVTDAELGEIQYMAEEDWLWQP